MTQGLEQRAAPLTAALRTPAGDRLGSFLLDGQRAVPDHCWAWLRGCWPRETFVMHPETVDEPAMLPLSERYRGRPHLVDAEPVRRALRWFDEADRCYRVVYAEPSIAPVGLLGVHRDELRWLEPDGPGFHACAPTAIRFEPVVRLNRLGDVIRLSVQALVAPESTWSGRDRPAFKKPGRD